MSFNPADMISLSNYEEYFILYVDNELDAAQKLVVEVFVAQHPHLEEELELLLSTKLTPDDVAFDGKEELLSPMMKLNAVDENLLLYIDDELPAAEKKAVEKKITADKDYALQHSLLLQTKLDASEILSYPAKKELYRHERKVLPFALWMRIAAAVVVLLFGSLFYLRTNEKPLPNNNGSVVANLPTKITKPALKQEIAPVSKDVEQNNNPSKDAVVVEKTPASNILQKREASTILRDNNDQQTAALANGQEPIDKRNEITRLNTNRFVTEQKIAIALNESITHEPVTSALSVRNTDEGTTEEPAVTDGDFKDTKKTPARGFFRKVSRFIERKTGIGTANADNELLIGSVALKLK